MNAVLGISIPTYKRPDQLRECVRSIARAGGLQYGIPVFVSDDSADDTNQLVFEELRREYPLIQTQANPTNLGIDGNILRSVDINTAEYAWLLGEDDRLKEGSIERVLRIIKQHAPPLVHVNYASVNADFTRTLKSRSLRIVDDITCSSDEFWRRYAWSSGFIGACVLRLRDWRRVNPAAYHGTWFAHVGVIMESCRDQTVYLIADPLVLNRCGTTEVFTWTGSMMDVLDGWRRLSRALVPLYGTSSCEASEQSFRRAHGLGTVAFLAYARAGGALTPDIVRRHIRSGPESLMYRRMAEVICRIPPSLFRFLQRIRPRR